MAEAIRDGDVWEIGKVKGEMRGFGLGGGGSID